MTSLNKHTKYHHTYTKTKRGHICRYLVRAKKRSADKGIPFDLDLDYLFSIATDNCPVFGVEFIWGRQQGARHRYTPSLDRIIPELGYVKGNVVFISMWANTIKLDATEKELYAVADWLHGARKKVLNAQKKSTTPVSGTNSGEGEIYPELGTLSATGTGEDSDDAHHHCGADARKDVDSSAKESGGNSVGHGNNKVGTPQTSQSQQDNWYLNPTYGWLEY